MTNEKTAARRERRIAARKAQILDAAAQVFSEKGFHGATTKEIADVADVSEGTIYNYFASKEDLLMGIMSRLGDVELREMGVAPDLLAQALTVDPRGFLTGVFRERHAFVLRNQPMLRAVLSEILVDQEFAARYNEQLLVPGIVVMEPHLQERIDRGQIRPVNVPRLVRFIAAVELGLLGLFLLGDPLLRSEWEDDELIESVVSFIIDGLSPQGETQAQGD
jgi:AcrR family transcriptional regulator